MIHLQYRSIVFSTDHAEPASFKWTKEANQPYEEEHAHDHGHHDHGHGHGHEHGHHHGSHSEKAPPSE